MPSTRSNFPIPERNSVVLSEIQGNQCILTTIILGHYLGQQANDQSLVVMEFTVGLCSLGMTIPSSITVDVYHSVKCLCYLMPKWWMMWSTYKSHTHQSDNWVITRLQILEIAQQVDWSVAPSTHLKACSLTTQHRQRYAVIPILVSKTLRSQGPVVFSSNFEHCQQMLLCKQILANNLDCPVINTNLVAPRSSNYRSATV